MPWRRRPVSPSARCITTSEARTIWWRLICPARDQPNLALFKRGFAEADGELPDKVEAIFRKPARPAIRNGKGAASCAPPPNSPTCRTSSDEDRCGPQQVVRGLVAQDLRGRGDGERRAVGTADTAASGWIVCTGIQPTWKRWAGRRTP